METKHTKGKWEFRKWQGEKWPEKRWSVGVKETNGEAICISPRYDFETEESEANGRLISMLPELLEALQILVENGYQTPSNKDLEYAKEVIKKATQ